jgi:hypothetical protein
MLVQLTVLLLVALYHVPLVQLTSLMSPKSERMVPYPSDRYVFGGVQTECLAMLSGVAVLIRPEIVKFVLQAA